MKSAADVAQSRSSGGPRGALGQMQQPAATLDLAVSDPNTDPL